MSDPVGKILRPDGTDVTKRDRSDDGAIVVRRNVEPGHNYKFGQIPAMPWHMVECPKCEGKGFVVVQEWDEDGDGQPESDQVEGCDLCYSEGEVRSFRARKYRREQSDRSE